MKVSVCLARFSFRVDVMSIARSLGSFSMALVSVSTPALYMFQLSYCLFPVF